MKIVEIADHYPVQSAVTDRLVCNECCTPWPCDAGEVLAFLKIASDAIDKYATHIYGCRADRPNVPCTCGLKDIRRLLGDIFHDE